MKNLTKLIDKWTKISISLQFMLIGVKAPHDLTWFLYQGNKCVWENIFFFLNNPTSRKAKFLSWLIWTARTGFPGAWIRPPSLIWALKKSIIDSWGLWRWSINRIRNFLYRLWLIQQHEVEDDDIDVERAQKMKLVSSEIGCLQSPLGGGTLVNIKTYVNTTNAVMLINYTHYMSKDGHLIHFACFEKAQLTRL